MLERGRTHYSVMCDRCGKTRDELEGACELEPARELARSRRWLECARKGRGVARWDWWCPACNPQNGPSPGGGLTTGHFAPKR